MKIIKRSLSLYLRQAYLRQNSLEWQSQRGTYCEGAEGPVKALKGPESFMHGRVQVGPGLGLCLEVGVRKVMEK